MRPVVLGTLQVLTLQRSESSLRTIRVFHKCISVSLVNLFIYVKLQVLYQRLFVNFYHYVEKKIEYGDNKKSYCELVSKPSEILLAVLKRLLCSCLS